MAAAAVGFTSGLGFEDLGERHSSLCKKGALSGAREHVVSL